MGSHKLWCVRFTQVSTLLLPHTLPNRLRSLRSLVSTNPSDTRLRCKSTLYVADTGNSAIRKINLNTLAVTTLAATEPTPNPDPNPNPNPNPGGGGGGGGGGGAPSLWFLGALIVIAALRPRGRHH